MVDYIKDTILYQRIKDLEELWRVSCWLLHMTIMLVKKTIVSSKTHYSKFSPALNKRYNLWYRQYKEVTTTKKTYSGWLYCWEPALSHNIICQYHVGTMSVKFRVARLFRQSVSGQAPLYLADDCCLVSDSTRRYLLVMARYSHKRKR